MLLQVKAGTAYSWKLVMVFVVRVSIPEQENDDVLVMRAGLVDSRKLMMRLTISRKTAENL